jgi:hypothetical protein
MQQLHFLQHMQTQLKYSSYVGVTGKWVWVYTDWYNDRCHNVTWRRSLEGHAQETRDLHAEKQHFKNHTKQGATNFPKIYKPPSNSSCQNCWHAVRSLLMTQNSWITAKLTIIWCFLLSACDLSHISVSQEQKNCNKYAENIKRHHTKFSHVGNQRWRSVVPTLNITYDKMKTPVPFRNSFRHHMLCTSPPQCCTVCLEVKGQTAWHIEQAFNNNIFNCYQDPQSVPRKV